MTRRAQHTPRPAVEWLLWLVWTMARPPVAVLTWGQRRAQQRLRLQTDVLAQWRAVAVLGVVLLVVQTINLGFVLR